MGYVNIEKGTSSLVLSMPHSATEIPSGIKHNLNLEDPEVIRTLHYGVDHCVPFVSGFFGYKSASRVWTTVPRAVLDPNRLLSQADEFAVEGGSKNLDAHGLIWRASITSKPEDIHPLLTKQYTREEFENLLNKAYHPFVNGIVGCMEEAKAKHGIAIHFQIHSMPDNYVAYVKEGTYKNAYLAGPRMQRGSLRDGKYPDLLLVDQGDALCAREIGDRVMSIFTEHGLLIERMPMRAAVASPHAPYGNPAKGWHTIGIEIVGRTFEPGRSEGALKYNPSGEKQYQNAFAAVFKALEEVGH